MVRAQEHVEHMLRTCWTNARNPEHILGSYLQYADHTQFTLRATLPIGVKGQRKKEKKEEEKGGS